MSELSRLSFRRRSHNRIMFRLIAAIALLSILMCGHSVPVSVTSSATLGSAVESTVTPSRLRIRTTARQPRVPSGAERARTSEQRARNEAERARRAEQRAREVARDAAAKKAYERAEWANARNWN